MSPGHPALTEVTKSYKVPEGYRLGYKDCMDGKAMQPLHGPDAKAYREGYKSAEHQKDPKKAMLRPR